MIKSKLTAITCFFCSMLCISWVQAHDDEIEKTLCSANEKIYFSCTFSDEKIVSICASGNSDPSSGYVQYRYGTPNNIEMMFPQKQLPPMKRFFVVNASEGSVNKDIIKFKNGSYTYLVSQMSMSNLTVLKNGKMVLRKVCGKGGKKVISLEAREGIETVPKSDEDFK
ncbi:hypothetical protein [Pseudomonas sp. ICMP 460]|uniref:hypothetical protein n=1 Tax=Pseudomonas sp. ICMP 460 TaxID=1718917 RepID=UPI0011798E8C|nr:hypothetical protein [Pseudomonas sp. ICMP 460]